MKKIVFTVPELARYLRMKPITIYKHIVLGKIPGFKVGSQWRFRKSTIDEWISKKEREICGKLKKGVDL